MSLLPVNDAQKNLQQLIDQVAQEGKPVMIQGENHRGFSPVSTSTRKD